jgi:2-C-methyl-D-erythritol 4-phosphate cytidylyltransferase
MDNNFSIIITAGGIGKRMGSNIPKQFIEVKGKPILMHTIECFYSFNSNCQIILTLPSDWTSYWNELIEKYQFKIKHTIVDGGKERYDSIKNALSLCEFDVIGVHDGVRPLVSNQTIEKCLENIKELKAVIPVLGIKESLRQIDQNNSKAVSRSSYVSVQTPQFFTAEIITNAYNQPFHDNITDDASLVEQMGQKIHLVEGNEENIKVTTPMDLEIINLLIK